MTDEISERVAAWERTAVHLAVERGRSVAGMTDDEAREIAEDLLSLVSDAPPKVGLSGLIEQQRIFATLRA